MSEWKTVRLDQIGRIVTGKTPKTSCPEYWDGEVPFVTPGDLQTSKHLLCTARCVTQKGAEAVKGAILPTGAICVSCIGVIGYVSMTTQTSVSNQQINSIIVSDNFDEDFVYYLLRNNWQAFKNMEGFSSVVSILNKSSFSELTFEVPDLPTQRRIAAVLGALDDKIENNRKICENLEAQALALFKSWFVDFEPWGGKMPEGWRMGRLSELIDVCYGKDHKKLADGAIPVFGSGGYMRSVERFLYDRESVLIPRKGTLNNIMYVNEPFWTVDTMFYSKMKRPAVAKFIHQFLKTKNMEEMNVGSAVPSMTTDILNHLEIVIPDDESLARFEKVADSLYMAIAQRTKESRALAEMRDALLPKLMSGRLRVDATACQGEIDVEKVEI